MSEEKKRWRFEYVVVTQVSTAEVIPTLPPYKLWYLFLDNIENTNEILALAEAQECVPREHPAHIPLKYLFYDTHDRIIVQPYEPFDIAGVEDIFGVGFIDRILERPENCYVWNKNSKRTWLHHPGDSAK